MAFCGSKGGNRAAKAFLVESIVHCGRLSLSRSCGGTAGSTSGSSSIALLVLFGRLERFGWVRERKRAHSDQSFSTSVSSWSSLNGLFPVGGEVEGDEQ